MADKYENKYQREKEARDYQERQRQRILDERPRWKKDLDNKQRDEEYAQILKDNAAEAQKKAAYDAGQKKLQEFYDKRQAGFDAQKKAAPTVAPKKPVVPSEISDQLQTNQNEKAYQNYEDTRSLGFKKGGTVKSKCSCMAKGGSVSSASKRADGCAQRGKTRGRMV